MTNNYPWALALLINASSMSGLCWQVLAQHSARMQKSRSCTVPTAYHFVFELKPNKAFSEYNRVCSLLQWPHWQGIDHPNKRPLPHIIEHGEMNMGSVMLAIDLRMQLTCALLCYVCRSKTNSFKSVSNFGHAHTSQHLSISKYKVHPWCFHY